MQRVESLSDFEKTSLSIAEMNEIRGGSNTKGGTIPLDEDILLPDPEPEEAK